ncbi:MAG: TIR domain-containing protein [Desulfarculus sp.]|nr:TIR domain-containing protein [Desulfarculus sp.]
MANPKHLAKLRQGVAAWNRWREKNPGVRPDLIEANLGRADLEGANLVEADLREADLGGADLSDADLTATTMGLTIFGAQDLRQVKGLETVLHLAPSTIGLDTSYKSRGNIPESFLRGAGVPDDFIAYMRSLVGTAIEYYSCFISYNSQDEECAQRLYADLQAKGVRCWFAPHDLRTGDDILDRIDESIRARDKLLLILSRNSIQSGWVETEVKTAFEEERRRKRDVLFPVRLDDEVLNTTEPWAAQLRRKRIGDFTRWKEHDPYQEGLARLLRDLKASAKA